MGRQSGQESLELCASTPNMQLFHLSQEVKGGFGRPPTLEKQRGEPLGQAALRLIGTETETGLAIGTNWNRRNSRLPTLLPELH